MDFPKQCTPLACLPKPKNGTTLACSPKHSEDCAVVLPSLKDEVVLPCMHTDEVWLSYLSCPEILVRAGYAQISRIKDD